MYKINVDVTCDHCIGKISNEIKEQGKIKDYSFVKQYIIIDAKEEQLLSIILKIEKLGYKVDGYEIYTKPTTIWLNFVIIGILFAAFWFGRQYFPEINFGIEFNLLLVIVFAVLSSFHCISMCGPIALKKHQEQTHLPYYIGRIISYSMVGFVLGLIGSFISISTTLITALSLIVGFMLILLGLSSIDLFKLPHFKFNNKFNKSNNSFILGLLNGFFPCAVLQVMWLYVITLANPFLGLVVMLWVAVISSAALYLFGKLSGKVSFMKSKTFKYILAIYVILMGLFMIFNSYNQINSSYQEDAIEQVQEPTVEHTMNAYYEMDGEIPANQEVRIYFDKTYQNGCNEKFTIYFPDGQTIYVDLNEVDYIDVNISETGTAKVVCWMGMQFGEFEVVE